jgi:sulfite reductase alpha subunit-like flavoprotein
MQALCANFHILETLNDFEAHLQFLPRISSRLYSVSSKKLSDAKI